MSEIPGPGFGGFLIKAHLAAVQGTAQIIAFPLMAACAIAYAARDRRLGIATALVSLPTFSFWLGVIAFAIGIAIHGF
jgi:hypothetical protein